MGEHTSFQPIKFYINNKNSFEMTNFINGINLEEN